MKRIITIAVFFVLFSQVCMGQWKKLWDFNDRVDVVYFLSEFGDSNSGFVGLADFEYSYKGNGQRTGGEIWKTIDGGKTWIMKSKLPFSVITDIRFMDSKVGWASVRGIHLDLIHSGGCYKTTDGGETWFESFIDKNEYVALCYNKITDKLFISSWGPASNSMVSNNQGATWQIWSTNSLTGYSFSDPMNGFVAVAARAGDSISTLAFLRTFDAGLTWLPIAMNYEVWQPLAIKGTSTYIVISEVTSGVFRSDNYGTTWYQVYQFPKVVDYQSIGHIDMYMNSLIVNMIPYGFFLSSNGGSSWYNICGPWNWVDTRFCINGNKIYAADSRHMNNSLGSGLWVNHTGRGYGPRLRLNTQINTVETSNLTPIDIFYPNESNYESVDSICFTMNLKGDAVGFESDSVADGWRVKWREVKDSTMKFCLERTTADTVSYNSLMLRIYLRAYVARDTIAQLTLDEVNFNQDVTFRDCMVPTLKATDTVNFVIQDECGDSTLRAFLNSKPILEIHSISPNPTSGDVTVDFTSLVEGNLRLQVINGFGNAVFETSLKIKHGINSYTIPIASFWSGTYFVRLQMGNDVVTGKFVKQ